MALKEGRWSLTSVWYDEAGLLFTTAVKRLHNSFERWMRDDGSIPGMTMKASMERVVPGEGYFGTVHVPSLWKTNPEKG